MFQHVITWMILIPLFGAVLRASLPSEKGNVVALVSSLLSTAISLILVLTMQTHLADLQAVETLPWIGSYSIRYEMGLDGLNAPLVLLVQLLIPLLIGYEWNQKVGIRGLQGLLLLLQSTFLGAACAQDLFLQFFFWALSSIPVYFLIGIWGGSRREAAAFRTIVAATLGNALLFAAIVLVYYSVEPHSFLIRELAGAKLDGKTVHLFNLELSVPMVAFSLVGLGLATRAPLWPLHGWFTQSAEEAPPSVLVAICGVMVPMAVYLFVRFSYTLFPGTLLVLAPVIVSLGIVNLIAGILCATAQRSLRMLLAFLCISEMGFLLLGVGSLHSAGLVGVVYHQFVLGLGLAGFGILVGLLSEKTGTSDFLDAQREPTLRGIATQAPGIAVTAAFIVASLLGFPGSGGFIGRALLILGGVPVYPWAVFAAVLCTLVGTFCLLKMYRSVFLGSSADPIRIKDLSLRERLCLFPVISCLILSGLYPKPLLEIIRPTALTLLSAIK